MQQHRAAAIVVALLVLIAAVDLAVLVAIGTKHPRPNTLSYEVGVACIQVLAIALLGGVLSLASLVYQLDRQERQHNADAHRDARQRCDMLVRESMRDVRSSYQAVKRSRRILQTRRWDPQHAAELVELYDEQLTVIINDAQLDFEALREMVVLGPCGVDDSKLRSSFSTIEDYLNKMVNQWRQHHEALIDNPPSVIEFKASLPRIDRFIDNTADFRVGVANPIRDVMGELRRALLAPDKPS
jgi:hypothetical protein